MKTLFSLKTANAVHSSIKLTNAGGAGMVRRGVLAPENLREYRAKALVDEGSVRLVISEQIAQRLGLRILRQQGVEYDDGRRETVGVTEAILIECNGRRTSDEALVTGNSILIGRV